MAWIRERFLLPPAVRYDGDADELWDIDVHDHPGLQASAARRLLGLDLPPGTRVNVQWLLDNGYLAVRGRS